jgi:hypothetical protein
VETAPPRRRRARERAAVQLTERDRRLLAFAAEQRFVLAAQPAALLDLSAAAAETRLHALADAGHLRRQHTLHGEPPSYRITPGGLRAIGSDLPAPRAANLAVYDHDLGLAWLMVAAERGRFGPLRAVNSERRMRSEDGRAADGEAGRVRHGVRLGGTGPGGRERLHYPDMVIVTETGHRIAFELELTGKPRVRREGILAGYAADRRIDLVVYLVADGRVGAAIEASAARVGIPQLVRVQRAVAGRAPAAESARRAAERRRAPERADASL